MELPLWLTKGLYEKKRKVVSVELPKVYREGWRTVFNADPNVVDLHKMGPYYYGLGSQMMHFDSPENPEIAQTLLQVKNKNKKPINMEVIKDERDQSRSASLKVKNNPYLSCTVPQCLLQSRLGST